MQLYKLFIISIYLCLVSSVYGATGNTQVVIPDHAVITGIQGSAQVTLSGTDIEKALSDNVPIETGVIASACIFTTHHDRDYDLIVNASKDFLNGTSFALNNKSGDKVNVTLSVSSIYQPNSIEINPGIATPLRDHSDDNSVGVNCVNQIKFHLTVSIADLRTAKADVYRFSFSASTSQYSG